jgi:hypothetical protein
MTVPGAVPDLVVSFRDLDEPRPLSARLIAVAHRHGRGWTAHVPDDGSTEHVTFDAVVDVVIRKTGVPHLLIVWSGRAA